MKKLLSFILTVTALCLTLLSQGTASATPPDLPIASSLIMSQIGDYDTGSITLSGATPGGILTVLASPTNGGLFITTSYCGSLFLNIGFWVDAHNFTPDAAGNVTFPVPVNACGYYLQALDRSSCDLSNVIFTI